MVTPIKHCSFFCLIKIYVDLINFTNCIKNTVINDACRGEGEFCIYFYFTIVTIYHHKCATIQLYKNKTPEYFDTNTRKKKRTFIMVRARVRAIKAVAMGQVIHRRGGRPLSVRQMIKFNKATVQELLKVIQTPIDGNNVHERIWLKRRLATRTATPNNSPRSTEHRDNTKRTCKKAIDVDQGMQNLTLLQSPPVLRRQTPPRLSYDDDAVEQ